MAQDTKASGAAALLLVGFCGAGVHIAMAGGKLALSLHAISLGGDSFTVGLLLGLYGLLPLFISVPVGRWVDRIGALRPMLYSCAALVVGLLIPSVYASIAALCAGAIIQGASVMATIIALNNMTGALGRPEDRAANFGWLALSSAIGLLIGPIAVGVGIDTLGHGPTLIGLAIVALAILAVLAIERSRVPGTGREPTAKPKGLFDLFRHRPLRGVFVVSAAVATSYELHGFLAPVYGSHIGLSASTIGALASAVALGVFAIRVAAPFLLRRVNEWRLIATALMTAGFLYAIFVQVTNVPVLLLVSMLIGTAMGITQPVAMALLHNAAPPGRTGEAQGLRAMIMSSMQALAQISLGALSGAAGLVAVAWAVSAAVIAVGWYAHTRARAERGTPGA